MRVLDCLLLLVFFLLHATGVVATEVEGPTSPAVDVLRQPPPDWVREFPSDFVDVSPTETERRALGGVWYLLLETQHDVASQTLFQSAARSFLTAEGIGDAGTITFSIDPSYETLVFHRIRIHRAGEILDRLPTQRFQKVRTEAERERQIYSGEIDVIAHVEGLLVGDVLEYAASIVGRNPVFDTGFAGSYLTSWFVPVREARVRLRLPLEGAQGVRTASVHGEFPMVRTVGPDGVELLWQARDIPAAESEDYVPEWIRPYGWIDVSDYGSWGEVADWAVRQYPIPAQLPPSMDLVMDSLRSAESEEAKVVEALRHVQENVRYVGMFDGVHSHRPHPLETIVRRGFGDCKDKSVLLCAMLRSLGIDAVPALVHTEYRDRVEEWLPAPTAFDHIITCVRIGADQYWIDPTQSSQRGPLRSVFLPDYRRALLVEPGVVGLTDIPLQGHAETRVEILEEFSFADYGGEAALSVISSYYGAEADRVRSSFARSSHDDIQAAYLDFYARSYPEIEPTGTIGLEEDPEQNRLVVRESYRVSNFWEEREGWDSETLFGSFYLMSAYDELLAPGSRERRFPFRVGHPVDLRQELWIHFPSKLDLPCESSSVSHRAFDYDYAETCSDTLFTATAHYRSHRDHVLPDEIERYTEEIRAAEAKTSFWVSIPADFAQGGYASRGTELLEILSDPERRGVVLGVVGGVLLLGLGLGVFFIVLGFRVGKKAA